MNGIFYKGILVVNIFFVFLFKAEAQSVGGNISGATMVCPNMPNNGFLTLYNYTGTILTWEYSIDGGTTWTPNGNPTNSQNYSSLTVTTCYRAIVQDGIFQPDTSATACITIIPPSVGGAISGGGTFCVNAPADTLTLTGETGKVLYWQYSINGGISWTTITDTNTFIYHPVITQNTIYQAVVQNGVSCPYDTSSQAIFSIDAQTVGGGVGGDTTVCYQSNGDTLTLTNYMGSIVSWIYSIDNGISWASINNTTTNQVYNNLTQTTLFAAVVKSGVCSIDTSTAVEVNVVSLPLVSAGTDIVIIQGQSSILNGSGNGNPLWSPSIGLSSDSLFSPLLTTTITTQYVLVVTDTNGCVNSDSVLVTVLPPTFSGTISNLFTPNNDGINDTWYIENIHLFPTSDVLVYNIYGNKVYEKTGYMNDWAGTYNGAPLPDGTYYYVLTVEGESGTETYKGSVDILKNK